MIPNTTPRPFRGSFPKPSTPKKSPKPIARMSEKRKEEIKSGKGQWEMFMKIWSERPHRCVKCSTRIQTPEPANFHHVVYKSKSEALRLDPENIIVICFDCHYSIHNKAKK